MMKYPQNVLIYPEDKVSLICFLSGKKKKIFISMYSRKGSVIERSTHTFSGIDGK